MMASLENHATLLHNILVPRRRPRQTGYVPSVQPNWGRMTSGSKTAERYLIHEKCLITKRPTVFDPLSWLNLVVSAVLYPIRLCFIEVKTVSIF